VGDGQLPREQVTVNGGGPPVGLRGGNEYSTAMTERWPCQVSGKATGRAAPSQACRQVMNAEADKWNVDGQTASVVNGAGVGGGLLRVR